ncbi:MAG TPA: DUF4214 domain-containing protein [Candidatus Bathyarchaeia archaeon]|nr:DUF4214 domain-containing protein [Candidatus Bathyarchaeia archaeon]
MQRYEITVDQRKIAPADRARLAGMRSAMQAAIGSGWPMFTSFAAEDVLRDTIGALRRHGVVLDESSIVNFTTIEAPIPAGRVGEVESLPFVRSVRPPRRPQPASPPFDSEGLPFIRSDVANLNGVIGTGVKVAIVDQGFQGLNTTVAASELVAIPSAQQLLVSGTTLASATVATSALDSTGPDQHGTACAEVVHEVAPGASLLLYRVTSTVGMEKAIRDAADRGAGVVLISMSIISTMADGNSATNPFILDIAYAKSKGTAVVVAAGDEALRHYAGTFTTCGDDCKPAGGLCEKNDSAFHAFDVATPLSGIYPQDDCTSVSGDPDFDPGCQISCTSALDPTANPSNFKLQLYAGDGSFCPSDAGNSLLAAANVQLGKSFTISSGVDTFANFYSLAVKCVATDKTQCTGKKFRINCQFPITEFDYSTDVGSLSDLAVVTDSISVGALDGFFDPDFTSIADYSSLGPTALPAPRPVKPDLTGPSEVSNYAISIADLPAIDSFGGSSAAAAHVAGMVALMQSQRILAGLPLLAVDQVRVGLQSWAIDLDDGDPSLKGPDSMFGYGRANLPDYSLDPTKGRDADSDRDGIPDGVECTAGCTKPAATVATLCHNSVTTSAVVKDNDVFTSPCLFVMQQYRDFFNREGKQAGIDSFAAQINAGMTRAQIIGTDFFNVAEFNNYLKPIVRFYLAYWRRIPKSTEYGQLQGFIQQYRASFNGATLNLIAQQFAASTDFTNQYQGDTTDAAFVTHLFNDLLQRDPTAGELGHYTAELGGGGMRGDVVLELSTANTTTFGSHEYIQSVEPNVFVIMMYVGMLRRSPNPSGYNFWVAQIVGGETPLDLTTQFLGTAEYRKRFLP